MEPDGQAGGAPETLRLDGQVAVVTGAGRGLGRSYAMHLAARGAKVVVNNRIRPGLEDQPPVAHEVVAAITEAGGAAVANLGDVGTDEGARSVVQTALEQFGGIDILVNNAGVVHFYTFGDYPDDELDLMLAIHLRGTWRVTQEAWPHFQKAEYGRVVTTVSRAAFFGDPQGAAYASAKGGIYGLTRALAVEGKAHGIKVNAVSPVAWTPLYASAPDVAPDRRTFLEENFRTELVSPVVVALAHPSCPFTGETLLCGGGTVNRIFVAQTEGAAFDGTFTPEDFMARLPDVWDEGGYQVIGLVAPGQRGQGTPPVEVPAEARVREGGV
jgi:NAD(P)-dependent dehydrogenase (short-subunit alcohol dehydrogenase family)